MGAVGITVEYNPFHSGHLRQLRMAAEGRPVLAVLSGDFVQRGSAAVFSKFARAEAAVRCGVSLVVELPLPWCLASAEGFARGAVGLMAASGVVDAVSFGSESGDGTALRRCAEALESPAFPDLLKKELAGGSPFAAARQRAAAALAGAETASVLEKPNDLLGAEYIRAADRLGFCPAFLPIPRVGGHDGPGSAGELRRIMETGEEWLSRIPENAAGVYARERAARRGPVLPGDLRLALMSRLRERSAADLSRLPDAAEGLENRLFDAIQHSASPEEAAERAKSKRYALSRLRRMVMCAALGVEKGMAEGAPPYIRVLAMDRRGMELLRDMRRKASLPVIIKSAHIRNAPPETQAVFELASRAHDLYVLGYGDPACQRGGEDYRATPFILE